MESRDKGTSGRFFIFWVKALSRSRIPSLASNTPFSFTYFATRNQFFNYLDQRPAQVRKGSSQINYERNKKSS